MHLKGVKKKGYNKKYDEENKEKISDKKGLIIEKTLRKSAKIVHLEAAIVT